MFNLCHLAASGFWAHPTCYCNGTVVTVDRPIQKFVILLYYPSHRGEKMHSRFAAYNEVAIRAGLTGMFVYTLKNISCKLEF